MPTSSQIVAALDRPRTAGDRSGHVVLWDTEGATASATLQAAHTGHITALAWLHSASSASLLVTGGQDGMLRVWDPRAPQGSVHSVAAHVTPKGQGAVSDIGVCGAILVTTGADQSAAFWDSRTLGLVGRVQLSDFPYSLAVHAGHAAVGCGDGGVAVCAASSARQLYSVACNAAAVRGLSLSDSRLFATGDDGSAVVCSWQQP
jgi:WD40 repeat protein